MAPRKSAVQKLQTAAIDEMIAKVRGKYGADAIVRGSDVANIQARRIPFGVFTLDVAIGGGIPKGRITMLYGAESSGKSTLALKAAGEAQKRCRYCHTRMRYTVNGSVTKGDLSITVQQPCKCGKNEPNKVVYFDIERTSSPHYARRCGFNPNLAWFVQPEYAEKGINVCIAMIQTKAVDMIVIDSIAMLTPTQEAEDGAEKWQQGLGARLVNKFLRMLGSAMNAYGPKSVTAPAIVLINQPREKIGVLWGPNDTLPFGRGQRHATSLTIELTGLKVIRMNDKDQEVEKEGSPIGRNISWQVKKNKVSPGQGRKGFFKLYTVTRPGTPVRVARVNTDQMVTNFGKLLGLIEQKSGGYLSYKGIQGQGVPKFVAAVRAAKQWRTLEKETRAAMRHMSSWETE